LSIETLAAAVFLHHHVGYFVDALVGGETAIAAFALAAAADGVGFLAFARVDDAILPETAIGTFHGQVDFKSIVQALQQRSLQTIPSRLLVLGAVWPE
jgi:hypothetical protein